ncbi:class I SAM-dependent methyltransferase [bacterium]|nr:class I SAM-dependent methyltransferase [bacterium]
MIRYPSFVFRALYRYLDRWDKHHQLIFMNYGYSEPGVSVPMDEMDEKNRFTTQLYHHMAEMTDLKDKEVVEVGSGRGGGLAYIARKFQPASAVGIDLEKSVVAFSNKFHQLPNLNFITGDAQKLPLGDNSCDVVLNVESSHRYSSLKTFFKEVHRVLRPGGYFLYTDFRDSYKWPSLLTLLNEQGFKVIEERDISSNILHSLDLDSERRASLVKKYAPKMLQKSILNFTGSKGTATYDYFLKGKFTYKSFMIQKNGDGRHLSQL